MYLLQPDVRNFSPVSFARNPRAMNCDAFSVPRVGKKSSLSNEYNVNCCCRGDSIFREIAIHLAIFVYKLTPAEIVGGGYFCNSPPLHVFRTLGN